MLVEISCNKGHQKEIPFAGVPVSTPLGHLFFWLVKFGQESEEISISPVSTNTCLRMMEGLPSLNPSP